MKNHYKIFLFIYFLFGYGNYAFSAAYVWNGAGVLTGTGGTDFNAAANWLVGGVAPASPPGLSDDCTITTGGFSGWRILC